MKSYKKIKNRTLLNQGSWRISAPRLWTILGAGIAVENRRVRRRVDAADRAALHIVRSLKKSPGRKERNHNKTTKVTVNQWIQLMMLLFVFNGSLSTTTWRELQVHENGEESRTHIYTVLLRLLTGEFPLWLYIFFYFSSF